MSRLIAVSFSYDGEIKEPVTLQEVKDYLRVDFNDDDTLINSLITSARSKCEKVLGLVLVDTTVKALYKNDGTMIELFYGPIKNGQDGLPTITGLNDGDSIKGWDGNVWIESIAEELNLTYESGWNTVPEWAKLAIKQQVAYNYENRGDDRQQYIKDNLVISPEALETLSPYRVNLSDILL